MHIDQSLTEVFTLCARHPSLGAYADQMVFWVINDVGNQHTESNGQAIGAQINCLAFAFQTTNDINNINNDEIDHEK